MDESTETSTKKRKRIEETANKDNEIDSSKDMPYHLNKLRALHKKLDSTAKDNSIAIKGTPNNSNSLQCCYIELEKSTFQNSLEDQGLYTSMQKKQR